MAKRPDVDLDEARAIGDQIRALTRDLARERELRERAEALLRDAPDHSDLDAATFQYNARTMEAKRALARAEKAEASALAGWTKYEGSRPPRPAGGEGAGVPGGSMTKRLWHKLTLRHWRGTRPSRTTTLIACSCGWLHPSLRRFDG